MNGDLQGIHLIGGVLPAALLGRIHANELSNAQSISGASYHLVGNEKPKDAAARAWSYLRGAWTAWRDAVAKDPGTPGTGTAREKWLLVLLDELGYGRLPATRHEVIDGVEYPISHRWHHVPIHLLGPGVDLDKRNPGVPGAARAPQAMLQEYLNRTDADLWGILSNGLRLRLLRDSTAFAGSAYVEFDLEAIFDGELYSEFQLMWLLCHVSRVEKRSGQDAGAGDCWLEEWRAEAAEAGTRALNRLREGVESAITTFGSGFLGHPANGWLRDALQNGSLTDREYHKALLRLIYRLLFLFVAEDRGALLDPAAPREARERYGEYFSTARLRRLSRLRSGGAHPDMWRSQRMVLAALGGRGMPQLGIPALGGLFDPDRRAPEVEGAPARDLLLGAEITNKNVLSAIRRLAWILVPGQRAQPIDYRHLGAEELGGVYESLLELVPRVDLATKRFSLEHLSGNERKTTGSYYTPPSLVSALLDASLDPVLDEAVALGSTPQEREANLLAVTVCDPASGSGGFLVAAARRIARRLAQVRSDEDEPTPEAVQHALHDVVARCVYGVDMNDLAAELAKVSLWLEALEPGKPLGFLDARIRVGNSLFGATPTLIAEGVPEAAFKELEGDDKKHAADVRKRNKNEATGQGLLSWADPNSLAAESQRERELLLAPSDDVDDIRSRGDSWESYLASRARLALKRQADAWGAAFVWPLQKGGPLEPTSGVMRAMLDDDAEVQYPETVDAVARLADEYRFFHWHLEFPEVFGATTGEGRGPEGWAGGFTCMLGNPPWERVKLQEQEFFAARDEDIAKAPNAAARKRLIDKLQQGGEADVLLYEEFLAERRRAEGVSAFLRLSGRYPLNGRGDVNTYAVFAELFRSMTAPEGRSGVIVPTGIATDATTQYFFKDLVENKSLVALYDFDNTKKLFADVDSRTKFCILSTSGRAVATPAAQFAFFLNDPLQIEASRFTLTPEEITLLNPNTGTVPIFRTRRDAEITLGIYRRVPVLINENDPVNGNPWGVSFMTMFHMSNDSHLFHTREQLEADGWTLKGNIFERPKAQAGADRMLPLYEAKMFHQYDHRWATYDGLDTRDVTAQEKQDVDFVVLPRYWVADEQVNQRLTGEWNQPWLLCFRDIARATDVRTMIPSAIPRTAVGHKAPLIRSSRPLVTLAILSSYVLDYIARQKVGGTSMTYFIVKQLPVLPIELLSRPAPWDHRLHLGEWIEHRVMRLISSGSDVASCASIPITGWHDDARERARNDLDAAFLFLFGVSDGDAEHILDAFPIVRRQEEAAHGSFLTKEQVLGTLANLREAVSTGVPYRTKALSTGEKA
ncbi:Eco57I restriction-modification methylase domain-containing protein [Microbacterium sp. B2969]|uniref:site-specific DNA-methyltransferase (adenine-specific) n=1 Tax=Microbacterium alkaliflavum TaxID=3248839 RepID=A0ABW7Q450_9MICO